MRLMLLTLALLGIAGPALAEVTLSFYAHPGARVRGGYLLFPHAYVQATGTLEASGEPVDWAAGFTARSPGPQLLFVSGRGVVATPETRYIGEGKGYLTVTVSDEVYAAIRARADWWNGPEGWTYNLRRRNCITFIADLIRMAGLATGREPSMSPGRFFEETAALNPLAAYRPVAVSPAPTAGAIGSDAAPVR